MLTLTATDLATLAERFASQSMRSVTLTSGVPLFWRGRCRGAVVLHQWWVTAGGDVVITSDDTRIQS